MQDMAEKIAWVSKDLYSILGAISKDSISAVPKRSVIAKTMLGVVKTLNKDLTVIPKTLKIEGRDAAAELRHIRTSSNSILQALNDKVCSSTKAIKLIKDIRKQVSRTHKILKQDLSVRLFNVQSKQGVFAENLDQAVEAATMKADREPIVLDNFSDLKYIDFLADARRQLTILENAIDRDNNITPQITEKQADQNKISEPNNNFTPNHAIVDSNKYEENANKNALETYKAIKDAEANLPKSVKIDPKAGYTLTKAPLLCVVEHFVPDSQLRKSGIKYIRVPTTFNAGYAPGLGVEKLKDNSYMILLNQLLLAFPIKTLRDPKEFIPLRDEALRALQRSLGNLIIVRFGNITKNKIVEHKNKDIFNSRIDQRQYFSNPRYPGIGFVWIAPQSQIAPIAQVKYVNVNIAIGEKNAQLDSKQVSVQDRHFDSAESRKAALYEEAKKSINKQDTETNKIAAEKAERIAAAKKDKDRIIGPLEAKYVAAEQALQKVRENTKGLIENLKDATNAYNASQEALSRTKPDSPTYNGLKAANSAAKLSMDHFNSQLSEIKQTVMPSMLKLRDDLKDSLKKAMDDFISKRKKQK